MQVTITPVARMVLEQLSAQDRAQVDRALRRLERSGASVDMRRIVPGRDGRQPYYVMPASEDLRLFLETSDDAIDVIDIATKAQLSFFQEGPG